MGRAVAGMELPRTAYSMKDRLQRTLRATALGAGVNLVLASVKLAAGLLGHSEALVADAVESLSDIAGSFIVWRGLVISALPPDEKHPYGHGKAESIAAAMIATVLLLAAVGIVVRAAAEIFQPHQPPSPWTLLVLVGVIAVKEGLFRFVHREGAATQSRAVTGDAWHHRSDAITSFAAGIGITIAWIGGPAWASADDVAAVFAAGIIGWTGWRLLRPALEDLMDASPDPLLSEEVRRIAEGQAGVDNVEKVLVRRSGWQLLIDMHLRVNPDMTVATSHRVAHSVKDAIRRAHPNVREVLIHVEPSRPG